MKAVLHQIEMGLKHQSSNFGLSLMLVSVTVSHVTIHWTPTVGPLYNELVGTSVIVHNTVVFLLRYRG